METELKRGVLNVVILKLLQGHRRYGYEIVSHLDSIGGGHLSIKDGTLYPILYRLESKGLISHHWEAPERGVPRKYYTLTESGAADLSRQIDTWNEFSEVVSGILNDREATS